MPISSEAADLIQSILVLDPSRRPSLDEILDHAFFGNSHSIPKFLPVSTLACPPSSSYMRQFQVAYDDDVEGRNDNQGSSLGR